MTLEEYRFTMEQQGDWAPGWDAVDAQLDLLYPGIKPAHYATSVTARAMFGGDQYLDGFSIFPAPGGYRHMITYGMSALYADPDAFGGEWSGWGYEMTIKLAADCDEDCMWAVDMLANLARYTYTSKRFFEPYQFVGGDGSSIWRGHPSALTALLIVPDTALQGADTLHGKLEFLQLVGITEPELDYVKAQPDRARELAGRLQADSPQLVTDLSRAQDVL